jgi:hypothetical protein
VDGTGPRVFLFQRVVAGGLVWLADAALEDGRLLTRVTAFRAGGCGEPTCPSLATLEVPGIPFDNAGVIVAAGHVIAATQETITAFRP